MRKVLIVFLVIVMAISMVACGKNEMTNTDAVPNIQETDSSDNAAENTADNETNDTESNVVDGELTEDAVRGHKVAAESDFEYEVTNEGVRITGYKGSDAIVVIPETIADNAVVSLTINSFGVGCTVRGVKVPSGVKEIEGAFANNTNLEVVIWESAEVAGANIFNSCTKLHTVIFGNALVDIGENAFFYCSSLKELFIPASVQSLDADIAVSIFYLCDQLTISGDAGSYIETFCTEQGLTFKAK